MYKTNRKIMKENDQQLKHLIRLVVLLHFLNLCDMSYHNKHDTLLIAVTRLNHW